MWFTKVSVFVYHLLVFVSYRFLLFTLITANEFNQSQICFWFLLFVDFSNCVVLFFCFFNVEYVYIYALFRMLFLTAWFRRDSLGKVIREKKSGARGSWEGLSKRLSGGAPEGSREGFPRGGRGFREALGRGFPRGIICFFF